MVKLKPVFLNIQYTCQAFKCLHDDAAFLNFLALNTLLCPVTAVPRLVIPFLWIYALYSNQEYADFIFHLCPILPKF